MISSPRLLVTRARSRPARPVKQTPAEQSVFRPQSPGLGKASARVLETGVRARRGRGEKKKKKEQTKLDASQTSTQCAREKSGYIPSSTPPPSKSSAAPCKGGGGRVRERLRQNKAGESANDHKAPWPYVTNKGREGRDNVGQVVLIKGITALSADHFTNC